MSHKLTRSFAILMVLVLFATSVLACTPAPTAAPVATEAPAAPAAPAATDTPAAAAPAATGKTLVGLSFSDFATERWKGEQVLMQKLLEEKGYAVVWQEANHDTKLQNDQIDNMVTQGAKALIVIAEDGDAAATAVDKAAAAGVKVIAYDRLIKSPNIAAYISFNNTEVGRQEALGVVNALKMDSGKWTADNPVKMMLMGGSPTDNNAILVRQGQMEVVQPYIDKGLIKIVADQWVDNWEPSNALKIMENVLTAQNNKIDAVVASNDGTALGALQALKAQKLAGVVPISGQDATADGCNSIVKGEQTVSVYKDTRLLSPLAVKLVDEFLKGQTDPDLKQYTMAELTNDKTKTGNVTALFLPVVQVTKDNVYDLIVKSGFQSYDDVYRDIPDAQRPPRPEAGAAAAPAAGTLVGLSFSDFATERWKGEQVLMQKLLEEKGYKVVWQEANHDTKLQNDQIDNMVTQGAKALIVIAEDGDAAATAVDKAAAAGVKVIAYDRLIKSPNIAAYISFNNTEVGRQEALGVVNALKMDSGKWTADNPVKMMLMGGSPTDNNAILVRQGQMEVVQPYIDKGLIKIVADQWVDNWEPSNALKIMENVLTAQNNKIDAVVASNDGTALGALQALKAQKLAGVVPISGQDATADGCNSIVKGEQTVSVYKDTRLLSPLAVKLVDEFLKGQTDPDLKQYTMAELTNDKTKTGNVTALFLPVVQVTKDNVYDLIVKSGFQSYDDVYRDIPDAQRPPKP
jgi:D-xylose transport system substrate-binding protein